MSSRNNFIKRFTTSAYSCQSEMNIIIDDPTTQYYDFTIISFGRREYDKYFTLFKKVFTSQLSS